MLAPARTLTSPFWWFYFRKSWRTSTKRLPRWKEVKVRGNWNVFGRGPLANPFSVLVLNWMLEHEKQTSSFWQGHLKMCWIKINLMLVRRNSAAEFWRHADQCRGCLYNQTELTLMKSMFEIRLEAVKQAQDKIAKLKKERRFVFGNDAWIRRTYFVSDFCLLISAVHPEFSPFLATWIISCFQRFCKVARLLQFRRVFWRRRRKWRKKMMKTKSLPEYLEIQRDHRTYPYISWLFCYNGFSPTVLFPQARK